MAHFAEIKQKTDPTGFTNNTQWVVERVVVIDNAVVPSDMHVDGETWCQKFFNGGTWKQTSYNSNFRGRYAGIGYVYDEAKDVFICPQPFASYTLNADTQWEPPVPVPSPMEVGEETYSEPNWDESNLRWKAYDHLTDPNNPVTYVWNPDTSAWNPE
jgi:hypothetical protein